MSFVLKIFGVFFGFLVFVFLAVVFKLIKKGRDSAWEGELVDKKYTEGEDFDTGAKKDYYTLIFKTKEGKTIKVGTGKEIYDNFKVGDWAEKVKGEFRPKKIPPAL